MGIEAEPESDAGVARCDRGMTTSVTLLEQTKSYLQAQLHRVAPDSILTQAWEEFYRVYSNLVRRFVLAQGLRGADADDCVQEVWSAVAVKLTEFERPRDRPGLRSWLYTVVRSKATDYLRSKSRLQPSNPNSAFDSSSAPCSREPDPAAALERDWERAMLRAAMDELRQQVPAENYRLLEMRFLEGRSEAETGAALGLTAEQVRHRKYRLMQRLQTLLKVYTGQETDEATPQE